MTTYTRTYDAHTHTCDSMEWLFAQALKSQLDMLQKRMMKECVMRPDLDGQLNRVSKRIADVEW
jgi:hypothetical protein